MAPKYGLPKGPPHGSCFAKNTPKLPARVQCLFCYFLQREQKNKKARSADLKKVWLILRKFRKFRKILVEGLLLPLSRRPIKKKKRPSSSCDVLQTPKARAKKIEETEMFESDQHREPMLSPDRVDGVRRALFKPRNPENAYAACAMPF